MITSLPYITVTVTTKKERKKKTVEFRSDMSSKTVVTHGKIDSRRHTPVRYRKGFVFLRNQQTNLWFEPSSETNFKFEESFH